MLIFDAKNLKGAYLLFGICIQFLIPIWVGLFFKQSIFTSFIVTLIFFILYFGVGYNKICEDKLGYEYFKFKKKRN